MTPEQFINAGLVMGGIIASIMLTLKSFKGSLPGIPTPAAPGVPAVNSTVKSKTDEYKTLTETIQAQIASMEQNKFNERLRVYDLYEPRLTRAEANIEMLQENYRLLIEAMIRRNERGANP